MPSRTGTIRKPQPLPIFRWLSLLCKFLISPMVMLIDSFRRKGALDQIWLYSFFLFTTVVMALTGVGILVTEEPLYRTLRMMAAVTESNEVLSGDLQPLIRIINKYALEYNVDPNLIFAIIRTESNFRRTAVSPAGAKGLMQIMPQVWREYSGSACDGRHSNKIICHPDDCIFDSESNIRVGVKYFRALLDKYQGRVDLALEAYNAGISNVRPGFDPKFLETKNYVAAIVSFWNQLRKETIAQQLQISLQMQRGLKWLFIVAFSCWLILFWWAGRKWFGK